MLTHIVLMRFTDPADAALAKSRLESLAGEVPEIRTLRVGAAIADVTGHHLALVTTHDDPVALKGYQEHPAHQAVVAWLREHLADRAVVDFEEEEEGHV